MLVSLIFGRISVAVALRARAPARHASKAGAFWADRQMTGARVRRGGRQRSEEERNRLVFDRGGKTRERHRGRPLEWKALGEKCDRKRESERGSLHAEQNAGEENEARRGKGRRKKNGRTAESDAAGNDCCQR